MACCKVAGRHGLSYACVSHQAPQIRHATELAEAVSYTVDSKMLAQARQARLAPSTLSGSKLHEYGT